LWKLFAYLDSRIASVCAVRAMCRDVFVAVRALCAVFGVCDSGGVWFVQRVRCVPALRLWRAVMECATAFVRLSAGRAVFVVSSVSFAFGRTGLSIGCCVDTVLAALLSAAVLFSCWLHCCQRCIVVYERKPVVSIASHSFNWLRCGVPREFLCASGCRLLFGLHGRCEVCCGVCAFHCVSLRRGMAEGFSHCAVVSNRSFAVHRGGRTAGVWGAVCWATIAKDT